MVKYYKSTHNSACGNKQDKIVIGGRTIIVQLVPRAYQLSIYESINRHGNTLVVLPTGLGKTLIALMLIRDRMKTGRCLFLTPTKPLAKQHQHSVMKTLELPDKNVVLVTGEVSPKKRKEMYLTDVIVSTPQTIKNDLENGVLEPKFSLVIFDECVAADTKVLLADGSMAPIWRIVKERKPVWVNSYNEKSGRIEPKEVIGFHRIPCKKNFVRVEAGDTLVDCTEDHLFLCQSVDGVEWKKASELDGGTSVLVQEAFQGKGGGVKISSAPLVSEAAIKSTYTGNWNRAKQHFYRTIEKLQKAGIFPFTYQNPNCLTMARLFGYALGDGWLTKKNGQATYLGFCGPTDDLRLVAEDLDSLDSRYSNISSRMTNSLVSGPYGDVTIRGRSESFLCASPHIVRITYALGFPVGDKAKTEFALPNWLMNAPSPVARAFLSGLISAECHVPTPRGNGRTIFASKLAFYKDKKLETNGRIYARDLVALFKKVGVRAVYAIRKGNKRKDKTETLKFEITIGNSLSNQLAFLGNVPFAYSKRKSSKAGSILAYLQMKREALCERERYWKASKKLHASGLSASKISKKLGIAAHTIESWLYLGRKPTQTSILVPSFNEWISHNRDNSAASFPRLQVKKVTKIKRPKYVYDLSVRDNHNYFANNVLVHNCHRAVGDYAYTIVAEKTRGPETLFVGLTASPGGQMDRIREVMKALSIENVEIRGHDDPDVAPYVQKSTVSWVPVPLSDHFKDIKRELDPLASKYAERLASMGFPPPLKHKGKFMQLRERILNIPHNIKYPALVAYSVLLHLLHMTELLETQGVYPLRDYLKKLEEKDSKSARLLLHEPGLARIRALCQKDEDHPKMPVLIDMVKKLSGKKMIVFVQYRSQIARIEEVLNSSGVSAKRFVGKKDGVTKKMQEETIADFREGKFDVLVASSIGEEGLDIPAVDAVIFYEPVPSEIRSIQRRGRAARLKEGQIIVLMTKGTRDEYYYYAANNREKRMKKILGGMQRAKKKPGFERADALSKDSESDAQPRVPEPGGLKAEAGNPEPETIGRKPPLTVGPGAAAGKRKQPPKQTKMTDF
ncbi:MAG: helicase-related protein [Candidatus Micrarchaeota archaeon]